MIKDDSDFRGRMGRIETLIEEIDRFADPSAQDCAREIVQALLEFHGAALATLISHIAKAGIPGRGIMESIARDDLTANLLLLHDLHPHDLADRVNGALDRVRGQLASHGGDVELLSVEAGVVTLRMKGSCHGCPSSAITLRQTITTAILESAPDAVDIVVEEEANPSPLASLPIVTIGPVMLSRTGGIG